VSTVQPRAPAADDEQAPGGSVIRFRFRVHAKAQLRILGARAPKRRARFPKALYGLPAFEIVLA
jgi:hypothetical protein